MIFINLDLSVNITFRKKAILFKTQNQFVIASQDNYFMRLYEYLNVDLLIRLVLGLIFQDIYLPLLA